MNDIFKKASKCKLRFSTEIGLISIEDLWDLPIENVDQMAIQCNGLIDEKTNVSFISKRTNVSEELKLQFEILKSVIETRVNDAEKAEKSLANKQRVQHLLELRQKKELGKDDELSIEEIDEMIAEIKD